MKKIGYLATGLILGLTISVASPVIASTVKTISAKINSSVSVKVNGEKVKLNSQPISYDNLNYLPVGEIGRALGLSVIYDKKSDTINLVDRNQVTDNTQPSQPVQEIPGYSGPEEVKETVQTAKLGESITKDGVTVSIDKIEYMPEGFKDNGVSYNKGFKLFVTIKNSSDKVNVTSLGGLFKFKTDSSANEKKANSLGNTIFLTIDGQEFRSGELLAKGQTATGYVYYQTNQDMTIKEVAYFPVYNNTQQSEPFGKWVIE